MIWKNFLQTVLLALLNSQILLCASTNSINICDAVERNDLAAVQRFVAEGANFNQTNWIGLTPLILAVVNQNYPMILEILKAPGLDVNYFSRIGGTAFMYAITECSNDIVQLLLDNESLDRNQIVDGCSPLHKALYKGNTRTLEILLSDTRIERNHVFNDQTPLDLAVYLGNDENVVVFVKDSLVDLNRQNRSKMTILHKISLRDSVIYEPEVSVSIAKAIIDERRTDLNLQDNKGKTALHYAAELGNPDILFLLVNAGTDASIEDSLGNKPIYYARERGLSDHYIWVLSMPGI